MEDFFKQFRENLENRPEPSFEEGDWRALEKKLARVGKKPPLAFAWWWAIPFLLLLLGANAFMLLEQRRVNQKIYALENVRDTVYHNRVVYITDTIYRARVVRETIPAPSFPGLAMASSNIGWRPGTAFYGPGRLLTAGQPQAGLFPTEGAGPYTPPAGLLPEKEGHLPAAGTDREETITLQHFPGILQPLPPAPAALMSGPAGKEAELPVGTVLHRSRRPLMYYLYPLRPKGLQLGAYGGGMAPLGNNLHQGSGFLAGVQALVEFSPSLRLWSDASYYKLFMEADRMDDALGVPVIDPPSDELAFVKADLLMPSFQFSAGMQYTLLAESRWRPFLGAGYAVVSILPHDVIYDFKNADHSTEWNLDTRVQSSSWQRGFVLLQAGVEYGLSGHWTGRLGLDYRSQGSAESFLSPRFIGARGGLLYRF